MKTIVLLVLAVSFSILSSFVKAQEMFSFKEKGQENYITVIYDRDMIYFEECFRHNPCQLFGEISQDDLDNLVRELYSVHSNNVLDQAAFGAMVGMATFLTYTFGEAALFMERDQIFNSSKIFIGTTVFPFLCATIPMMMHEKSKAYNTALMLQSKMSSCDRRLKEVNLKKMRAAIDDLIETLS